MPKMRWRPGLCLCPGPRWGSSRRSPRPLSRLGKGWDTRPQEPHPLGASILVPSALAAQRSGALFLAYSYLYPPIFLAVHHCEQDRQLARAGPARQFTTEFPDKGWTKNSINRLLVKKVRNCATRNFRHFRRCKLGRIFNKNNCMSSNLLASVLCLNVCGSCVPNIMSLGICFIKTCTSSKLARLLDTASKFALFLVSGLKGEKLIKKANLHEN